MSGSHYTMCTPLTKSLLNRGMFNCNYCFLPSPPPPCCFFLRKQKERSAPARVVVERHCSVAIWGCPGLMCFREKSACETACAAKTARFREMMLGVDPRGVSGFYTSLGQRETVRNFSSVGSLFPHSCRTPLPP